MKRIILSCKLAFLLQQLVLLGIDLGITFNCLQAASIASSQFSNIISINTIFISVCTIDVLLVVNCCLFKPIIPSILSICLMTAKESLIFIFILTFNHSSNNLVIARSSIAILFIIVIYLFYVAELNSFIQNNKNKVSRLIVVTSTCLLFLSIAVITLNCVLVASLNPQLNKNIGPSNIKMGFFNMSEISQLQNGTLDTNLLSLRTVGALDQVVYNQTFKFLKYSNSFYYYHVYSFEINCSNQRYKKEYKDCEENYVKSLTVYVVYLNNGPYPSYNCVINKWNETCADQCVQLMREGMELILIQSFNFVIEPAWKGLGSIVPRINLTANYDLFLC
jgi:hypothetical protein